MIAIETIGTHPKRQKYIHHVNVQFGIDAIKHHAPSDSITIELDEEKAAENSITRALVDYIELCGQELPFVKAFLKWMWVSRDGPALMREYESQSDRVKDLKKK